MTSDLVDLGCNHSLKLKFTSLCFVPSLAESGSVFLRREFLKVNNIFSLFIYYVYAFTFTEDCTSCSERAKILITKRLANRTNCYKKKKGESSFSNK